jgi:hypothetical protein
MIAIVCTCNYDLRRKPQHVDFLHSDVSLQYVDSCCTTQSDATLSDHRGIKAVVVAKRRRAAKIPKAAYGIKYDVQNKKPIGWRSHNTNYNCNIETRLGIYTPMLCIADAYTDGSYFPRVVCPAAGWSFALFDGGQRPVEVGTTPVVRACGQVRLDRTASK